MDIILNKRFLRERLLSLFSTPNPQPLFVFGNQKSGTTAIATLLAAATGLEAAIDFAGAREPFIGRLLRGEDSVAQFVRRNAWPFSSDIVKEPSLSFVAPQLMDHFPGARSIFIVRDPWTNIRSMLDRYDLRGDTEDLVQESTMRINRNARAIFAGEDLGLAHDHFIAILARRWSRAARLAKSMTERTQLLRYEDFCSDKSGTIHQLADRFGLSADRDFSHLLNYAFQPRGNRVEPKAFFGRNLRMIDDICGPLAATFGYRSPSEISVAASDSLMRVPQAGLS